MLDGDVHADRSLLHVRMLHRAALVDMTSDAFLKLCRILIAQTGVGGVDDHLFVETDVCVIVGVIGAVHNDFRALALAQRMLDGELA